MSAKKKPPPVVIGDPSAAYVRLPLRSEILSFVAKYHALGAELAELLILAADASVAAKAGIGRVAAHVAKDVKKIRRR